MLPHVGILDLENRLVPVGKIGEVCIRGANVTKGYLNRPEANKEAYAGVRLLLHPRFRVLWLGLGYTSLCSTACFG